jgi:hypothetical protein
LLIYWDEWFYFNTTRRITIFPDNFEINFAISSMKNLKPMNQYELHSFICCKWLEVILNHQTNIDEIIFHFQFSIFIMIYSYNHIITLISIKIECERSLIGLKVIDIQIARWLLEFRIFITGWSFCSISLDIYTKNN